MSSISQSSPLCFLPSALFCVIKIVPIVRTVTVEQLTALEERTRLKSSGVDRGRNKDGLQHAGGGNNIYIWKEAREANRGTFAASNIPDFVSLHHILFHSPPHLSALIAVGLTHSFHWQSFIQNVWNNYQSIAFSLKKKQQQQKHTFHCFHCLTIKARGWNAVKKKLWWQTHLPLFLIFFPAAILAQNSFGDTSISNNSDERLCYIQVIRV